jgi:hypothetical protein
MRLEYSIAMEEIDIPRFSVEADEGIGKLFTLATVVLNVLDSKGSVEIVFHGLNQEDPERKIQGFHEIIDSSGSTKVLEFAPGKGGRVPGSSSYYQWVIVSGVK